MEFRDVIYSRRSVRKYSGQPVPDEILEEILQAGLAAPSAVNLQPWYFVAIQSREEREKFNAVMEQVGEKVRAELEERFPNHPDTVAESQRFIRSLGGAPVVILGFCYKEDYLNYEDDALESVSAAMENMLLTACSLGLGGCWLTAPIQTGLAPDIQRTYAPGKGRLVGVLSIGYAADGGGTSPKRKPGRYVIL